jgi:drug/metabolite transporter (DMT)-like permease
LIAAMGAIIKSVAEGLPNEMIVFFRNLFGLLALVPLLTRAGMPGLKTRVFHLHLVRGLAGVAAMYCFFYAIAHIKLADAMLLKLTTPILIPVVAFFWLQERFSRMVRYALLVGFAGVFLIIRPGLDLDWVMLIALLGSAMAALAKVAIRRLSSTEPAVRIVFYFAAIAAAVSAVPLAWGWQTPTLGQWASLLAIGPLATLAQLLMTRGYASAPASRVGIFTYSSVIFGASLGWWFWDELWDLASIAGAVLVASAGAMALRGTRHDIPDEGITLEQVSTAAPAGNGTRYVPNR